MWEEGPEVHSSSIGAVLAGLTMWHDHGYYDYKYKNHIDISDLIPVVGALPRGRRAGAARSILPRESASRPSDLAQLSLLWPYNILKDQFALQEEILDNIENHLVRAYGVVRYPGDRYFNSNQSDPSATRRSGRSGWLAVDRLLEAGRAGGANRRAARDDRSLLERAKLHLSHLEEVATPDGRIAELFTGGKPITTCRSAGRSRYTWWRSCRCGACRRSCRAPDGVGRQGATMKRKATGRCSRRRRR